MMLDTEGTASTSVIKLLKFMQVFCLLCIRHDFLLTCSGAAAVDQQVTIRCKDNERKALLTLKKGLAPPDINPYPFLTDLSTWGSATNNTECCNWDGVSCNDSNGHVIGFELAGLTGEIGPTLLELHHLNMLFLHNMDFGRSNIPEFIGSFKKLENLYLNNNNFSGDVPYQLGNLTSLRGLDLSTNSLTSKDLSWLSNLILLDSLDLSSNQLGGPLSWLSNLTLLVTLDLSRNQFGGPLSWLSNLTLLIKLDLWSNQFGGPLSWLSNLTLLSSVDLSHNQFEGPIPDLKAFPLFTLHLRHNNLTGQLPTSIGQLSRLNDLDVSQNSLEGTISDAHFTFLQDLQYLDLSFNSLNFTPHWIPPSQLIWIVLADCNMGPHFPPWLQNQTEFTHLDLSSAGISGEVPSWFWNHPDEFRYLNLSHNSITGLIPDLSRLASTLEIDISFNNFSGPLPLFNPDSFKLDLSHNMFSGTIQSMFRVRYGALQLLDLSNNQLSGDLSNCSENMPSLVVLNLAENKFDGTIPSSLGSLKNLQTLILRNNNFTGELTSELRGCELLGLIDCGRNALTGNVPTWMGSLTNLVYLILGQNNLYGNIPPEICRLSQIQVLDLSQNNISGRIPRCFQNLTSMVQNNGSTDVSSVWLQIDDPGDAINNDIYVNNAMVRWKRQESQYKNILGLLKLIDLSSNNLVGNIPLEISRLVGLASLNLSRNHLSGNIISEIGSMKRLESLDLSGNKLSGEIPASFAELNFLGTLDLSNNNLSGKIPKSTQLQSFDASSYAGNNNLCGDPLPNCMEDDPRPKSSADPGNHGVVEDPKDGGFSFIQSLVKEYFISAILGFIVGFWVVVGPLLIMKKCLFLDLNNIGDWLYVMVTLSWTRLIRYMKSRK